jgi:hypothetical protein
MNLRRFTAQCLPCFRPKDSTPPSEVDGPGAGEEERRYRPSTRGVELGLDRDHVHQGDLGTPPGGGILDQDIDGRQGIAKLRISSE